MATPLDTTEEKALQKDTIKFLAKKKDDMKKSQYRNRFDTLYSEIDTNLVNTFVSYGQKVYEKSGWGSMVFYNKMNSGAYDISVYPMKLTDRDQSQSGVPTSQEPIAFSKIMIATSVLAGKMPDCQTVSDDKVYSKAAYELWKRNWLMKGANGQNTISLVYQYLLTYGWAAWRTYPKRVAVPKNGVTKILFDDIYREPLDPYRTWLGLGFTNGDYWSQFEVYYEKDMLKEDFFAMYPDAALPKNRKKLEYCGTSQESKDQNSEKSRHSVTIGYYENPLLNRFIVACGKMVIYDGEIPNDECYGSVSVAHCMIRDINDPYGVGLYELMRGNTAIYSYINSLNAQEVEAEIFPLLFGPQIQNGSNTYKRSPNYINPKTPGSTIDVVRPSGNIQGGINFANQQKLSIEENTGVNNIVAGQNAENTLGSTVILKEAATNRLTPARNSMQMALQTDAHIFWSWAKQTYSVDKIFIIDTDEKVMEFVKQNPTYFVEGEEIRDDDDVFKGYAIAASPNLRLNFDFDSEGKIQENVDTIFISSKRFFDELKNNGHESPYIEFLIDPNSMLLPSQEIQKQTDMALFPIITNHINLVFSLRATDPENAATQLKTFENFLEGQKKNIFDYIPKNIYDSIMSFQPSPFAPNEPMQESKVEYKNAPADIQRQMEEKEGYIPSQGNNIPPQTPGTMPPIKKKNPGVSNDVNRTQPLSNDQIKSPRSPLGSANDASMGRAARLPVFFPGS